MRVLMFGWEFPPHISGGLGTACFGLTRSLVDQNVHVTFVLPRLQAGDGSSHVDLVGANSVVPEIEDLERLIPEELLKFIPINSMLSPYRTSEQYMIAVQELREELERRQMTGEINLMEISGDYAGNLKDEVGRFAVVGKRLGGKIDFDVIHAHDWMTYPAGIEAKRISGKPLVVHVHATEYDRCGNNINTEIFDIEKYGMHAADKVIAVSHRTKQMIVDKYSVHPDKITVVHNAVDKTTFLDPKSLYKIPGEKLVLFLGRITQQKGPEFFIDAAKIVYDKCKNARFIMAGSGDMLPAMIEKAAFLGMQDRFHFTGFLRGKDIEKMYSISDVYVMPSVSEPFGITPLEAMRHGVPCIVSKQTGAAEILPNAVKIDFWDVELLAESIIDIIGPSERADEMTKEGFEILREISWATPASIVKGLYQELTHAVC